MLEQPKMIYRRINKRICADVKNVPFFYESNRDWMNSVFMDYFGNKNIGSRMVNYIAKTENASKTFEVETGDVDTIRGL